MFSFSSGDTAMKRSALLAPASFSVLTLDGDPHNVSKS